MVFTEITILPELQKDDKLKRAGGSIIYNRQTLTETTANMKYVGKNKLNKDSQPAE